MWQWRAQGFPPHWSVTLQRKHPVCQKRSGPPVFWRLRVGSCLQRGWRKSKAPALYWVALVYTHHLSVPCCLEAAKNKRKQTERRNTKERGSIDLSRFMPAQTEHPIVSFFHRWDQFTLFNHTLGYYLKKRPIGTNQTQTNNPKLSGQLYYWDHAKAQITKGIGKPQCLHNSAWSVFKLSQTLVYFKTQ